MSVGQGLVGPFFCRNQVFSAALLNGCKIPFIIHWEVLIASLFLFLYSKLIQRILLKHAVTVPMPLLRCPTSVSFDLLLYCHSKKLKTSIIGVFINFEILPWLFLLLLNSYFIPRQKNAVFWSKNIIYVAWNPESRK